MWIYRLVLEYLGCISYKDIQLAKSYCNVVNYLTTQTHKTPHIMNIKKTIHIKKKPSTTTNLHYLVMPAKKFTQNLTVASSSKGILQVGSSGQGMHARRNNQHQSKQNKAVHTLTFASSPNNTMPNRLSPWGGGLPGQDLSSTSTTASYETHHKRTSNKVYKVVHTCTFAIRHKKKQLQT